MKTNSKSSFELYLKTLARIQMEKDKKEALELVVSYAKDLVEFWPKFSLRQIPTMAAKVKALKEALELTVK